MWPDIFHKFLRKTTIITRNILKLAWIWSLWLLKVLVKQHLSQEYVFSIVMEYTHILHGYDHYDLLQVLV